MILPAIAAIFAGPTILALPEPSAATVTVQAVVRLPELSPREELAVAAVAENLLEGTEEYSRATLRRWGSQTGAPPRVELMPGFVRIGVSVPKDQASLAVSMADSLLRRAELRQETLEQWKGAGPRRSSDYWSAALYPTYPRARDLRYSDVRDAYRRYFRPESTVIALAGGFEPGLPVRAAERFQDWTPPKMPPPPFDSGRTSPVLSNPSQVSTVEFRCGELNLAAPDFSARLLAAYALGVGKGSSLFRVVREQLQFSYRQEGLLWPCPAGLRLRLLMARADPSFEPIQAVAVKEAVLRDVGTWTEERRERAIGMAAASLELGIGDQPFCLSGAGRLGESLEDRALLRAYWRMASGLEWDERKTLAGLRATSLDEMKTAALQLLEPAAVQCILGMGGRRPGSAGTLER